jgi:hypothetical protein
MRPLRDRIGIALATAAIILVAGGLTPGRAINIEITNINFDNFPGIHVFARATDDSGNYLEDLGPSNFDLRENGTLVNLAVEAQFGYMAVALVMDASGSMTNFTQQVISSCTYFVNGMDDLDKGAIVRFADYPTLAVPMTYNKTTLLQGINAYNANGSTDLWDGIGLGIAACYYEAEKKAVIAFTDGQDNMPGMPAGQLPDSAGTDIAIYTIGIGNVDEDSLIYIAEQTGGFFLAIDSVSQMQAVLTDIRNDIGNLYDIYYVSPDTATNGSLRALELTCEYWGESDWDTISYIAPSVPPPVITLSSSTQQLLGVAQTPGSPLNVSCSVTTANGVDDARIYYKTLGAFYFSQADLIQGGGHNYYYNIPGSVVQNPGVEFYFQVTDTRGATVTSPKYEPGNLPYFIAVLPNTPPVISYEPPDEWLIRRTMDVYATINDATNNVTQATLYYRNPEDFFYTPLPMTSLGNDLYKATVPGIEIAEREGLMMFITAWDDHGLASYWHLSDAPFCLNVVYELTPTPPAVVLTPDSSSIVIPATGGSFNYLRRIINPLPSIGECDAWCDMVHPSGVVQQTGEIVQNLTLPGGGFQEQSYVQWVPDTAIAGLYWFRAHTGDYSTLETFYTDSFSFFKSPTAGPTVINFGWAWSPANSNPFIMPQPIPDQVCLSPGSPNPFNAVVSLDYQIPVAGFVRVTIHDVSGREIICLGEGNRQAGTHRLAWEAAGTASGIYFCRLQAGQVVRTTKLCLVR